MEKVESLRLKAIHKVCNATKGVRKFFEESLSSSEPQNRAES